LETIYGSCAWKLVYERVDGGIKLLRAQTGEKHAVLPDELFGLPVIALGDHALAPTARKTAGEEVEILCGRNEPDRTNRDIETLTLPRGLEVIENYAFYGCSGLKSLELYGNIKQAGTELFMNCRSFEHFTLHCSGERVSDLISMVTLELSRELSADIYLDGREKLTLVFPEYVEIYNENVCGRNFDLNIQGGGYPYHSCFEHTSFSLAAYDSHWDKYLSKEHEPDCALRLAWERLRSGEGLTAKAEDSYRSYLKSHGRELMEHIIRQRDMQGLSSAIKELKPSREETSYACALARDRGFTQALALLLESGHKQEKPAGRTKSFEL